MNLGVGVGVNLGVRVRMPGARAMQAWMAACTHRQVRWHRPKRSHRSLPTPPTCSCGRCSCPGVCYCTDIPPDASYSCTKQAAWGKVREAVGSFGSRQPEGSTGVYQCAVTWSTGVYR